MSLNPKTEPTNPKSQSPIPKLQSPNPKLQSPITKPQSPNPDPQTPSRSQRTWGQRSPRRPPGASQATLPDPETLNPKHRIPNPTPCVVPRALIETAPFDGPGLSESVRFRVHKTLINTRLVSDTHAEAETTPFGSTELCAADGKTRTDAIRASRVRLFITNKRFMTRVYYFPPKMRRLADETCAKPHPFVVVLCAPDGKARIDAIASRIHTLFSLIAF